MVITSFPPGKIGFFWLVDLVTWRAFLSPAGPKPQRRSPPYSTAGLTGMRKPCDRLRKPEEHNGSRSKGVNLSGSKKVPHNNSSLIDKHFFRSGQRGGCHSPFP